LDPTLISPAQGIDADGEVSRLRDLSLSTQAITALLGYELPSQAEGIRRAFDDRVQLRQLISDSN